MQTTDIGCEGNLFLDKLVGSQSIVVPQLQYKSGLKQMMEKTSEKFLKVRGLYLLESWHHYDCNYKKIFHLKLTVKAYFG